MISTCSSSTTLSGVSKHWTTFVKSPEILGFLAMARMYQQRPSVLIGLTDVYTAFCFDEACGYIMQRLDKGDEPVFRHHYSSFTELYKQYGGDCG